MQTQLAEARALVTGGASGIGRAIAGALAAEGARVAIADRDAADLGDLRIRRELGTQEASEDVVAEVCDAFGGIDLLVSCPAVARHEPTSAITPQALSATLDSNLAACVWTCRTVGRRMAAVGRGSILVIGSTAVYTPLAGESLYRARRQR